MKPMTNVNATFLIVFGFRIRHLSALVDKTNNVNFTCQFTLFSWKQMLDHLHCCSVIYTTGGRGGNQWNHLEIMLT